MPGPARADRRRPAERPLPRRTTSPRSTRVSALAFELPPRAGGARAARGARPRARRRAADGRRARRRPPRARALPRPARVPAPPATCSSSTRPPRCRPRCGRARTARDGAALLARRAAGADAGDAGGSSSCARADAPRGRRRAGERLALPAARGSSCSRRTRAARGCGSRGFDGAEPLERYLRRHGRPIRYALRRRATGRSPRTRPSSRASPGSAEMPSAGRPFTPELVTRLVARGVAHRAAHAPHRRVVARAPRAAVPRALRACPHATARLVNARARLGRAGRSRSARRWCARSRPPPTPDGDRRAPAAGWTEPGRHARARRCAPSTG